MRRPPCGAVVTGQRAGCNRRLTEAQLAEHVTLFNGAPRFAKPFGLLGDGDVCVIFRPGLDASGSHAGSMTGGDDGAVMMRRHG